MSKPPYVEGEGWPPIPWPLPPPPSLPAVPVPAPLTAREINARRQVNGLVALTLLPAMIQACERGAAVACDHETKVLLYAEAARARALLAETP